MITKREAAIISAYTGFMLGKFSDMHEYAEQKLGRQILTHEFAESKIAEELREKSRKDFVSLNIVS
jgi:hypothetical protein